ncbi:MAG: sulfatase [Planctomycetota bacterium]|nr:sulfatase [Planctomycetota bacterium]MDA1212895.1 sulfatase [Planctomycetota bacterium]
MRGLLLALGVLCSVVMSAETLSAADSPPNVVFIISDDQGYTDYGFLGNNDVATPNIDKLAAQSLVYRRGFVTTSLCCPSLATIISGRYPHQHKITGNDPPVPRGSDVSVEVKRAAFLAGREVMNGYMEAVPTIPRVLGKKGYLSFQTGKWWQGNFRRGGFTHGMTRGERHGDEGLDIGRKGMQPIFDFIAMTQKEQKPFFLWYAPIMPHTPHTPPQRLLDKYIDKTDSIHIARYWAMIEWFDETCGELLDHLDEQGLADNTIVVYLADNGWIQSPDVAAFAPKNKTTPYNYGTQTPIMIRWPGHVSPRMSDESASSIDLMPTILDALGIVRPEGLPGLNLLDHEAVADRKTIFGESFLHTGVDLVNPAENLLWRWVIDGEWRLIVPRTYRATGRMAEVPIDRWVTPDLEANLKTAKPELYRIAADPFEEHNLAADHPAVVAELLSKLDDMWRPEIASSRE